MITPKEVATLVDWPNPGRRQEIHDFILSASARDIQMFLHCLDIEMPTVCNKGWRSRALAALDIRLADDQAKASERLENHTRVLVDIGKLLLDETKLLRWLTIGLLILTAGLLVFTIYLVVTEQRPHP